MPKCQHQWKYKGLHLYGMHRDPKRAAPFFFVCETCEASKLRIKDEAGRTYEQWMDKQASKEIIKQQGVR